MKRCMGGVIVLIGVAQSTDVGNEADPLAARYSSQSGRFTLGVAQAYNFLHIAAVQRGEYGQAERYAEQSLALRREAGDKAGAAQSLMNIGWAALKQGNYAQAEAVCEESLALWLEIGGFAGMRAVTLSQLGAVAAASARYERAASLFKESLHLYIDLKSRLGLTICLQGLVLVAAASGALRRVAGLAGAIEAQQELSLTRMSPVRLDDVQQAVESARAQLGQGIFAEEFEAGRTMTMKEAAAYALETETTPPSRQDVVSSETHFPDDLTAREVELLRLIVTGKSNQEIAEQLVLSVRTVERHISNIYQKIGATGRSARATATAYAIKHGLNT
jgi:DNA-binding CsgD family transcriptional regulator